MSTPVELALLAFLGVVCWLVSTLGAGGGAILFLPAASFFVDPKLIPPLLAVASLVSSLQRCWLYRRDIELRIVAANIPGLAVGVLIGAYLLRDLDAAWLSAIVGVFLLVLSIRHFMGGGEFGIEGRPANFAAASFATGSLSAVVGASGPLMNPVYLGAGILKQAMIGTKAASTLFMQLFKIGAFLALGLLGRDAIVAGLAVGVGTFVGNALGAVALGHVSTTRFKDAVYALLFLAGASMLVR